jgi:basic membrane protein A
LSVQVLYPAAGLGDRSYADSVYAGLIEASRDTELQVTSANPANELAASQTLLAWTESPPEGAGLIIAVGGDRTGAIDDLNCEFGGWEVLLLDGLAQDCPGLESHLYDVFPASFLAGVAAMAVSTKGRAAILGGRSDPVVDRFVRGFAAGVDWAGGEITEIRYLSEGVDGFSNPEAARAAAEELYQDADVVFPVAGGSGLGVFSAAEASPGRYTFGVDVDQSLLAPGVVVGSVVKHLYPTVADAIRRAAAGTFAVAADEGTGEAKGVWVWTADLVLNLDLAATAEDPVEGAMDAAVAAGAADLKAYPW